MKPFILPSLLLASFLASPALARNKPAKPLCIPAKTVFDRTTHCVENDKFVDAAEDCLRRLEDVIFAQTKAAQAGLKGSKGSQQNKNFSSAESDYKHASINFGLLIALAAQAAKEVDGYLDQMVLPDHIDDPEHTGGDELAYVEKFPCYAEARDSIQDVLKDVNDIRQELEQAKAVSDANQAASGAHSGSLNTVGPVIDSNAAPAQGKPAAPQGPQGKNWGQSDISGTEEKKEKR